MEISKFGVVNSNLNNYRTPFKGEASNAVSNPINEEIKPEIVGKNYADATKSIAMAQILVGNDIKPNMNYMDYVDKLMKQGKCPIKDFIVKTTEKSFVITELNPNGNKTKEISFFDDGNIGCKLYNPKTQKVYKTLETLNGKLHIAYNDKSGKPVLDEVYRSDGSLERNAVYKKCEKSETSVNGNYNITGIEIPAES